MVNETRQQLLPRRRSEAQLPRRLTLLTAALCSVALVSHAQEIGSGNGRPSAPQLFGNVGAEPVDDNALLRLGSRSQFSPPPAREPAVAPVTQSPSPPVSEQIERSKQPLVAQAPGAGGAGVAPVPASPQVQVKPAAVPPAAPAPAPAGDGGVRFEIRTFDIEGSTLIPKDRILSRLQSFVGKSKDFGDVQKALETVERLFVDGGFGSVQVLLPEQELDSGTVKFKVIEPKIAKVVVEGNKEYTEENILRSLPAVRAGEPPNSNVISSNLRLANENPGKTTTVLLRAGSNDGEVDAVVKVTEDKIVKFNASLDNSGTDNTNDGASGNFRMGIGATHANMFGRDHTFAMQAITSPEQGGKLRGYSKDVAILGLSYRIPLYDVGGMLDITAGYSNVNSGAVQNIFNVSGRGSVFGIRFTQNLNRIGDYEHRLIYAADWRAYENNVRPVGGGQGIVPDITVKPISLTYAGTYRESTAETNFYLGYTRNLPGGGDGGSGQYGGYETPVGTTSTGTAARAGGRPGYTLWRYGFTHYRAFSNDWQVRFNMVGQETRDRLIAPEQFGIGGANSVRGFIERAFSNDYGVYANFEVYTPDVAPVLKINNNTKIRILGFYDTGHLVRNGPLTGDTARVTASGGGLGLRVTQGAHISFRLDAAWSARPSNTGDTERPTVLRNFRMHGSIVYLF